MFGSNSSNNGEKLKKVTFGLPVEYQSMYGYTKNRVPVLNSEGQEIGHVKEEIILGEDGEETGRTYYTRSFQKPGSQRRFYASPSALIIGFGGSIGKVKSERTLKAEAKKKAADEAEAQLKAEEAAADQAAKEKRAAAKLAKSPAGRVTKKKP